VKYFKNLTLLVPVYNGGADFYRILRSLEELNNKANVIIYDDGSSDDSYQVACEYAKKSKHKVRVIHGGRNRGYFRVIKILLKICPTNFFIFLGHDDQLSNNFLDEFNLITAVGNDVACIFTDIASINPAGIVTSTWPNAFCKEGVPYKILCREALKTFHKNEWGNLFVAIWSKRILNYKTLLQIMRCVPNSSLTLPLKRSGFLNDNMAVLRSLSVHADDFIFYNKSGVYFKKVDPERLSEGGLQYKKEKILHNSFGYISVVAHFMLPQIKQKWVATLWMLRYLYIYFGIAVKALIRNPSSFDVNTFFIGLGLILTGYAANISSASGVGDDVR
jgi:glycosyltransferase involved in cell wall biosynthesis